MVKRGQSFTFGPFLCSYRGYSILHVMLSGTNWAYLPLSGLPWSLVTKWHPSSWISANHTSHVNSCRSSKSHLGCMKFSERIKFSQLHRVRFPTLTSLEASGAAAKQHQCRPKRTYVSLPAMANAPLPLTMGKRAPATVSPRPAPVHIAEGAQDRPCGQFSCRAFPDMPLVWSRAGTTRHSTDIGTVSGLHVCQVPYCTGVSWIQS